VIGINQNYSSRLGTPYHIQVEDRGPVFDEASEEWVRRVNVIVYANYGEPRARIVYGRDHDLPDLRTRAHNAFVQQQIATLATEARNLLEEREARQVGRIKALLWRYYQTRDEAAKSEYEEANAVYPFVFARAWQELRADRARAAAAALPPPAAPPEPEETVYPLDPGLRDLVLEIERVAVELRRDVDELKARGAADDILQSATSKLLARAQESLTRRDGSDFATKRLEVTRNSLVTAYRQVRAQLGRSRGQSPG
jgi:hypothetical protein